MGIKRVLESISAAIAPHACPMCEGGAGVLYDAETGVLERCPACDGSGRADVSPAPGLAPTEADGALRDITRHTIHRV